MADGEGRPEPFPEDGKGLPGEVQKPVEGSEREASEDMTPYIILGIILGAFFLGISVLALTLLLQ